MDGSTASETAVLLDTPVQQELRQECPLCLRDDDDHLLVELWEAQLLSDKKFLSDDRQRTSPRRQAIEQLIEGETDLYGEPLTVLQVQQHFGSHRPLQPRPDARWARNKAPERAAWIQAFEREWRVLRFVSRLGLVTIDQVAEVFYRPFCADHPSASSKARTRLPDLAKRQLLYRYNLNYRGSDSPRVVYGLGAVGRVLVKAWLRADPDAGDYKPKLGSDLEQVVNNELAHRLLTAGLLVRLSRDARERPAQPLGPRQVEVVVEPENFWAEEQLGFRYHRPGHRNEVGGYTKAAYKNLWSDAFLTIGVRFDEQRSQLLPLLVENDTGVSELRDITQQVSRYVWLAQSKSVFARFPELWNDLSADEERALFDQRWQVPLLFVTRGISRFPGRSVPSAGERRAKNLCQAVRELSRLRGDRIKPPIFVTTHDAFQEGGLQAPVVSVWDRSNAQVPLLTALMASAGIEGKRRPGFPRLDAQHILRIDWDGAKPARSEEEKQLTKRAIEAEREQRRLRAEEQATAIARLREWDERAEATAGVER
jgi:hypothetical protein